MHLKADTTKAVKDGADFAKIHGFKNQIDYFEIPEKVRKEEEKRFEDLI